MRTRQIHGDFWKSENVADISHSQRLLFIGLWAMADREGMLLNQPRKISAEIFPYDAIKREDVEKWLNTLNQVGLVEFGHDEKNVITFIYIPKFNEYQHIHPNEARSKIKCNYIPGNYTQCKPTSTSTSASTSASTCDARPNSAELVAAIPVVFGDDVMRLGQILAQRILDNDPKARIPTTEKQKANWLDSIEKIHRLDGREWLEIEQVINWCHDDGFWKGNILSASKLRKQFPQLLAKMKSNGGKKLAGSALTRSNTSVIEEFNKGLGDDDERL